MKMAEIKSVPIIKNIGYMWHRKYVNWQKGRELIGTPDGFQGGNINFADQAGIYVLLDRNLQPVYIGQSGKGSLIGLYDRLKDHTVNDNFCAWERFSWYGFYSKEALQSSWKGDDKGFDKEYKISTDVNELMNVIESILIRTCRPSFNRSWGCLTSDNSDGIIEWYCQEAEWKEQEEEFNKRKHLCETLKKR